MIPDCALLFYPLLEALNDVFYPALFGSPVSQHEVQLFALPARFGGLGINDPVESAPWVFSSSREGASVLVNILHGMADFCLTDHLDHLVRSCREVASRRDANFQSVLTSVFGSLPPLTCCTVRRAFDFQTLGWLAVLPLACHQFDLSLQQFHDALSLRYHRPLEVMPSSCDGCDLEFSLLHTLDCCKGGLVTQHHNEMRNALGDLAALAYQVVICEPICIVQEGGDDVHALITALGIRGIWLPQIETLFDVRVTDADASSYMSRSVVDM